MCYLPLSYLAALELDEWNKSFSKKWVIRALIIFGSIFSIILILIPFLAINKSIWLIPYINDPFTLASLSIHVKWLGLEYFIGFIYAISLVFFVLFLMRRKVQFALWSLVLGIGLTMMLFSKYVVPNIELYSQGPAIEFYESLQSKNKYVTTVGFKSYAHYFYGRIDQLKSDDSLFHVKNRIMDEILERQTSKRLNSEQRKVYDHKILEWMKTGRIDKPVYFVSRTDRNHLLDRNKNIEFLYQRGGYVFYKRNLINRK